ncbi:MAG: YraN family protein [Bacteroidia bacterium]|nr:YraN family protein [Bacteroidia bacterium]
MTEHLELGKQGEDLACAWYEKRGYKVMARNWRLKKLECDLILSNDLFVVFAEVKTRSNISFGEPQVFVTHEKQLNLLRLANFYMQIHAIDKEARFDIVSVVLGCGIEKTEVFEDAFNAVSVNMRGKRRN